MKETLAMCQTWSQSKKQHRQQYRALTKQRKDQVSWRSKCPLLTSHTHRVPLVKIKYTGLPVVKTSLEKTVIAWLFTVLCSAQLYVDVVITCEGLPKLGLCSAFRAYEEGRSLSSHTCCDIGNRFVLPHPKDCPIQSHLTTQKGM
jgi:hypothetical protein